MFSLKIWERFDVINISVSTDVKLKNAKGGIPG